MAISSELNPEVVDLVIVGFILAMHDADKMFGHLGDDVSPRPGFGGATCEWSMPFTDVRVSESFMPSTSQGLRSTLEATIVSGHSKT